MTYSVYQHWDPLKVCIVGRSYPPEFYSWITIPHVRSLFEKIAIETEEDYQSIIKKLESFGVKLDKYGRERPEIIKWVDPRTGEQVIVRADGSMTPQGRKLRAMMQTFRVNKSNHWDTWIDREFVSLNDTVANNPWDLDK